MIIQVIRNTISTALSIGILITLFSPLAVDASVYVKGYYRKDGTYVAPHYRSNPDGNPYNNWSYPGNTNPHTGDTATGNTNTYLENYCENAAADNIYCSGVSDSTYSAPSASLSCPEHSYLSGDTCYCNSDYVVQGNSCVLLNDVCVSQYGVNSYGSGNSCYCSYGYIYDSASDSCILDTPSCPLNSHEIGDQCYCNVGYILDDARDGCVEFIAPPTPEVLGVTETPSPEQPPELECPEGYWPNLSKTRCIEVPEHAHPAVDSETEVWLCDIGYRETTNGCELIVTQTVSYPETPTKSWWQKLLELLFGS